MSRLPQGQIRPKPWKWRAIAVLGRAVNALLPVPFALLGRNRQAIAVSTILEHLEFVYTAELPGGRRLKFFCPAYKPAFRGQTVLTKQPEVPQWIDGFELGSVYWDVGANVGAYALYAGLRDDLQVLAFEPEASNYFVLTRNVALNAMSGRVKAYCLALSETQSFSTLSLFHMAVSGSKHAFGDPGESWVEQREPVFQQGMIAMSIDELVYEHGLPAPNHLKIDVDGIEDRIVRGARRMLADMRLRSIVVEQQDHKPREMEDMHASLRAAGFEITRDAGANKLYSRVAVAAA